MEVGTFRYVEEEEEEEELSLFQSSNKFYCKLKIFPTRFALPTLRRSMHSL